MHSTSTSSRDAAPAPWLLRSRLGSVEWRDLVALTRLERSGWLDAEWRQTENSRRARFYSLTRAGRKQLDVETAEWSRRTLAVARLLKAEG